MNVLKGIGKTIKWILILGALLIVVIVVIAIFSLGKAGNDADKQSANVTAHLSQIRLGMTETQVKAILGKPDSTQRSQTAGLGTMDEWYYGTLSAKGSYQFSFTNGKLEAKNRY
jgi:outer membrane protein assembly factor BamE (lipoprotein component of BamABCDE complex)